MGDEREPQAPAQALTAAPPPARPADEWEPAEVEAWVRAAVHQDRRPGSVLVVRHPLRTSKVPRDLLDALKAAGCHVEVADTKPDRVESVIGIRDAMKALHATGRPLDVLVMSGDGSLDHHVLVAAFWAFYPDLVSLREGEIRCDAPPHEALAAIPAAYREAFLPGPPRTESLTADEATIKALWVLRMTVDPLLRAERSVSRIVRRAERHEGDPLLRVAVFGALFPDRLVLRPRGFDLSGLATASRERTFQGLYPFIRAISVYPAGTAADNALYAGVPGWLYAQASRVLARIAFLDPWRRSWEHRVTARFVEYFLRTGAVVPARFSIVGFDGDWQVLSSHAVSGPSGGFMFSADLSAKTRGLAGYLLRLPSIVIREGLFGSTVVRLQVRDGVGRVRSTSEEQMAEGLYTNRAFIAGVGSVPSTNPTSFAGQSSLVVAPPIVGRTDEGLVRFDFRGVGTLAEAIAKGLIARGLHLLGFNVQTIAGGGKFALAAPQHQVSLKEGEELDVLYRDPQKRPRAVPTQVSGDPFQAWRMTIRVAWGPLPLLAAEDSLLMASARRSLTNLRIEQTYRLRSVYIGGLRYFRHRVGEKWTLALAERTGLFAPPQYLPRGLPAAQRILTDRWQAMGAPPFLDTSERGIQLGLLGRRGRYAHTSDHMAHLVLVRERGTLLVRQMRSMADGIYEQRTSYRAFGAFWILHDTELRRWTPGESPQILQEEHYFRSADAFRQEAPTFFPFVTANPDEPALPAATEEITGVHEMPVPTEPPAWRRKEH